MSRTYYGKNGKELDANLAAGMYLDKITLGLFELIGCSPKTEDDCKIVARILRNRINFNQYWSEYWPEVYGVKHAEPSEIEWQKKAAEFFETCGGTMEEEEYYEKYSLPSDNDEESDNDNKEVNKN